MDGWAAAGETLDGSSWLSGSLTSGRTTLNVEKKKKTGQPYLIIHKVVLYFPHLLLDGRKPASNIASIVNCAVCKEP